MTIRSKSKLADTLSQLILDACDDMYMVSKDDRYMIDLGRYHNKSWPGAQQCHICMAGSVIAGRMRPNEPDIGFHPGDFKVEYRNKLYALDSIRGGFVLSALEEFYEEITPSDKLDEICLQAKDYCGRLEGSSLDAFLKDMRSLSKKLADIGY